MHPNRISSCFQVISTRISHLVGHELDLGEFCQPKRLPFVVELLHLGPRAEVADGRDGAVHAHRALHEADVGEVAVASPAAAALLGRGRRDAPLRGRLLGRRRWRRRSGLLLRRSSLGRGRTGYGPTPRLLPFPTEADTSNYNTKGKTCQLISNAEI